MARKSYVAVIVFILILAVIPGIYFLAKFNGRTDLPEANPDKPEIVDVDWIAKNPENFEGYIGVEGKVIKVDEDNTTFALGCEDECLMMPVRYDGEMPNPGSQVVVYGEVKGAEDGKYVFEGKDVKLR